MNTRRRSCAFDYQRNRVVDARWISRIPIESVSGYCSCVFWYTCSVSVSLPIVSFVRNMSISFEHFAHRVLNLSHVPGPQRPRVASALISQSLQAEPRPLGAGRISSLTPRKSCHLLLSAPGRTLPTHLPRLEHLITQQQVTGNASAAGDAVAEHPEGVVHTFLDRVHGFAGREVQADDVVVSDFVL